jgi:hypothetical protein
MAWISVHEQLKDHRKVRDLMRSLRCGRQEAIGTLVMLWMWGINNADRDGNLINTTASDIMDGIMSRGQSGVNPVDALMDAKWIDKISDTHYILHDWDVWQKQWYDAIDKREKDTLRKRRERATKPPCPLDSHADSPRDVHTDVHASPSPTPSPNLIVPNGEYREPTALVAEGDGEDKKLSKSPPTPYEKFIDLYNRCCPTMPRASLTEERKKKIYTRWKERPDLAWWETVFATAEAIPYFHGENKDGWRATIDYFIQNGTKAVQLLERNPNVKPVKPVDLSRLKARFGDGAPRGIEATEELDSLEGGMRT